MYKLARKLFGLDEGEESPYLLLFFNSFFTGIFLVTYDVGASTLFLDHEDLKIHLKESIMYTGGLGMIITAIFSYLQNRVNFKILNRITQILILGIITFLAIGLEIDNDDRNLIWAAFLMIGPSNALLLLCFYGSIRRYFSVRDEKKYASSDNGALMGSTMFSIIFLFVELSHAAEYLFISTACIFAATFINFIFQNKNDHKQSKTKSNEVEHGILDIAKNKYIRLIAILVLLSAVSTIFIENSFLTTVERQFNGNDLTRLLILYTLALNVVNVVMQLVVGDRVIDMFGIRTGLMILPLLLLLFTILASIAGSVDFGSDGALDGGKGSLLVFLIFISLNKLFLQATREGFEDPIFKERLFIVVDSKKRLDVQSKVESIFTQFSIGIAGLVLTALATIEWFQQVHFSYILVFVALGYGYVAVKVFTSYQDTLKTTLVTQQHGIAGNVSKEYSSVSILKKELKSDNPLRLMNTARILEKVEPVLMEKTLEDLVYDNSPDVKRFAINKLVDIKNFSSVSSLKNSMKLEELPELKSLTENAIQEISTAEKITTSPDKLSELVRSKNSDHRYLAARIIHKSNHEHMVQYILDLMRDVEPRIKIAAIISAGKVNKSELWPLVAEHLNITAYSNAAAAAFNNIGDEAVPFLESTFFKTGQTLETMLKIIQIYGRLGTPKAIEALWNKIDFPDKKILSQVLYSLSNSGIQASEDHMIRIRQTIEQEISKSAWDIAAYTEIGSEEFSKPLKEAILNEIEHNDEKIFMLLALVYDRKNIQLVKENIESRSVEGVLFAIELLNVFIDEDLKPLIFPLLDEMPVQEKIQKLQVHFPRPKYSSTEVLLQIINRDYNMINRWTKACALYKYPTMPDAKVCDDLIANLFNPDPLLRETAAFAICVLNKEEYLMHSSRIHPEIKRELDEIVLPAVAKVEARKKLRIEKILFLKNLDIFSKIPGTVIAGLADLMIEVELAANEDFSRNSKFDNDSIYLLGEGKYTLSSEEGMNPVIKGVIIAEEIVSKIQSGKAEITSSIKGIIYKMDREKFYEMLADQYDLAQGLIPAFNDKVMEMKTKSDEKTEAMEEGVLG